MKRLIRRFFGLKSRYDWIAATSGIVKKLRLGAALNMTAQLNAEAATELADVIERMSERLDALDD